MTCSARVLTGGDEDIAATAGETPALPTAFGLLPTAYSLPDFLPALCGISIEGFSKGAGMISGSRSLLGLALVVAAAPCLAQVGAPGIEEIIQRSLTNMQADWKAQPDFTRLERDEDIKGNTHTIKTYRVLMIDGSPYERMIAINDEPLTADQEAREERLLREEIARRANEPPAERAARVEKYRKGRQRTFNLMHDMVKAFNFELRGKEDLNGRETWVLDATPRPDYQPTSRETKILTGMDGTLWIDCQDYQWVKAEASVIKPVWFGWFLAKVVPGTRFLLTQAPVTESLWLPSQFRVEVRASLLWWQRNFIHDEIYKDYHPAAEGTGG